DRGTDVPASRTAPEGMPTRSEGARVAPPVPTPHETDPVLGLETPTGDGECSHLHVLSVVSRYIVTDRVMSYQDCSPAAAAVSPGRVESPRGGLSHAGRAIRGPRGLAVPRALRRAGRPENALRRGGHGRSGAPDPRRADVGVPLPHDD